MSRCEPRSLRILFVGESWSGSSARSMREALGALPGVIIDPIDANRYFPKYGSLPMRAVNRLRQPWQRVAFENAIRMALRTHQPHVFLAYKGNDIGRGLLGDLKGGGVVTVNIFPDYSPHAYGSALREAIGEYDLVISTKPFHPPQWRARYGYNNHCVFVPHGYDPAVHYWRDSPGRQDLDVVLVATWREEYHALMREFADLTRGESLRVGVAGAGWLARRRDFPSVWRVGPGVTGRGYGELLRTGRIAIAPVNTHVVVGGVRQHGDEETTRTYELAAARCFFVHRRTDYVRTLFDESTEVPLWDDATQLTTLIRHYLTRGEERRRMAAAAHARAVPEYSIPNRAIQVLSYIRAALSEHGQLAS